jgi:hypothetical protein
MNNEQDLIPCTEAAHEIELVSRRLGLLHLAFARALVDELGEKSGKRLILKAIKNYGIMVGSEVKAAVEEQGLALTPENYGIGKSRSLPTLGMHSGSEEVEVAGKKRLRAHGCVMAQVWKEHDEDKLGRLYCYVDPAKYMAYNPDFKLAHIKAIPDGDECCEFCVERTTAKEREDFASDNEDWSYIDQCHGE